jgi:hypothetical protein
LFTIEQALCAFRADVIAMFDDTEFHRAIVSASFAMVRAMVAEWWWGEGSGDKGDKGDKGLASRFADVVLGGRFVHGGRRRRTRVGCQGESVIASHGMAMRESGEAIH